MESTGRGGDDGRAQGLTASFCDLLLVEPVSLGPCGVGQSIRNFLFIFLNNKYIYFFLFPSSHAVTL